ncbi:3'-5' exonuclease [Nonomuraea sp. NPDC050328]|uniref:3'-5' exonuclease n=1 Tax=Nonomuraea sp. NPDC050328 TaxID=3364361 RepID=UPI0037BC1F0E
MTQTPHTPTPSQTPAVPISPMAARPRRTSVRTLAHTSRQLREALGWEEGLFNRALAAGVVPPPDMQTPRWSGRVVDDLLARRDQLTAAVPDLLDAFQARERAGLSYSEWRRAEDAGLLPAAQMPPYWPPGQVDELAARAEALREQIPPQPLGARRCAELLAELTGLQAVGADIEEACRRGLIAEAGDYKGWPLYDVAAVKELAEPGHPRHGELIEVIATRLAWLAGSLPPGEAAARLGWREEDLARVAAERGLIPAADGRYAGADVAALADDEDLVEQVRRQQLLGPEQAAQHAEMRRRDFDYCVAAGWVRPLTYVAKGVGRYKVVDVPLYAVGDIEDMLTIAGVDWEAVRAVKPGEVSPLREHTRLPISRAQIVRAFCDRIRERWSVEVWPRWHNAADQWEIDWEVRADGHPTRDHVAELLESDTGAREHRDRITLSTAVGEVIRWARASLEPGTAVIVDTETTGLDGVVIEIAVICAATGQTLLDTLVNPGIPVEAGARAVHGITDGELADAPSWAKVAPAFLKAVAGREVLAYNAPFDQGRIRATHRHAGLEVAALPSADRWHCLMEARSVWARVGYWMPLGGGHRALGDAKEALGVLHAIATPTSR